MDAKFYPTKVEQKKKKGRAKTHKPKVIQNLLFGVDTHFDICTTHCSINDVMWPFLPMKGISMYYKYWQNYKGLMYRHSLIIIILQKKLTRIFVIIYIINPSLLF